MSSEGIEPAHQWPVGMHAASMRIQENAGAVFIPLQQGPPGGSELFYEPCRGAAPVVRQPRYLVGIHLDLLVSATLQTTVAGKVEPRLPREIPSPNGEVHA